MFCGVFRFGTTILGSAVHKVFPVRSLYGVRHNAKRGIFYVSLKDGEPAVLRYTYDGKIMDMQSISVPPKHQGRGLARLLAEAAFTYAIVHGYYMVLTCEYMQKLYLATKNPELEEQVVGPKNILQGSSSESIDPESVLDLPDPNNFTSQS